MRYVLREEQGVEMEIDADTPEEAEEQAHEWAREGDYNFESGDSTIWARTWITPEDDPDDEWDVTTSIDPPEPECPSGGGHRWESPHELLGGLKENPGVRGKGGGVVINEVCVRCGCERTTDTWAQNMATGEQGLTSVSYQEDAHNIEAFLDENVDPDDCDEIDVLYRGDDDSLVRMAQAPEPFDEWYAVEWTDANANTETTWHHGREEAREEAEVAAAVQEDESESEDEGNDES
jgi:hypothetical protein